MKTSFLTVFNLILQTLIFCIYISIFSIITDQLVINNGDWKICLLVPKYGSGSGLDQFSSNLSCNTTQVFSFTCAVASIFFIFAFIFQIVYKKRPNFTLLLFVGIVAASFSLGTLILCQLGILPQLLLVNGKNTALVEAGRVLTIADFGLWLISLTFLIAEHN